MRHHPIAAAIRQRSATALTGTGLGLALALAACGASTQVSRSRRSGQATATTAPKTTTAKRVSATALGHFAGYYWRGKVDAVSAQLTVPTITGGPQRSFAGSWIGVQARTGGGKLQFVQVGINEVRVPAGAAAVVNGEYFVFWSDIAHGYHPTPLFPVAPNDIINVNLKLIGSRWQLQVSDRTTSISRTLTTDDLGTIATAQAEWLQEDIWDARTKSAFPYPELSPVRFARIAVNGHTPPATALESQWMSVGSSDYGPSPMWAGSFTIAARHASSLGKRYLAIITPRNIAVAKLLSDVLLGWSATTSAKTIQRVGHQIQAISESADRQLTQLNWPPALARDIALLSRFDGEEWLILERYRVNTQAHFNALMAQLDSIGERALPIRIRLRTALGLPTSSLT